MINVVHEINEENNHVIDNLQAGVVPIITISVLFAGLSDFIFFRERLRRFEQILLDFSLFA